MSTADTHAVLIRPLATGRWEILEYATSARSAVARARKQRDGLSYGDLILAIDIAEISAIQERGQCLYFVNKTGAVTKAPRIHQAIHQPTWLLGWEGPDADAYIMLHSSTGANRKLLVTAACAVARVALQYVTTGYSEALASIKVAEAWARGSVTMEQVKKVAGHVINIVSAYDVAAGHSTASAYAAFCACSIVSQIAFAESNEYHPAASAAHEAAKAMPGDYGENLRQLSHIVREYIPLHVVLESRV